MRGGKMAQQEALSMALTRDFKETVQERAQRDPAFRWALLREGIACLLDGDVEAGKVLLRDYFRTAIRGRTIFSW